MYICLIFASVGSRRLTVTRPATRYANPKPGVCNAEGCIFWQTTQTKFSDVLLPKRARDLSGQLVSLLGTLFKIEVPQSLKEYDIEQAWRKDCDSWSCQVEAIFFDALDLCVRLKQRDHKTIFRWPAVDDDLHAARRGEYCKAGGPILWSGLHTCPP